EQSPRVLDCHVLLSDMNAVGARGQRNIDAIIDDEGYAEWVERGLYRARLFDQAPCIRQLVAQLHERCSAICNGAREIDERVPARVVRIDDRIEPQINHVVPRNRFTSVGRSSWCTASMISTAKLPGPRARSPAISPATPSTVRPPATARKPSRSTAVAAATSA